MDESVNLQENEKDKEEAEEEEHKDKDTDKDEDDEAEEEEEAAEEECVRQCQAGGQRENIFTAHAFTIGTGTQHPYLDPPWHSSLSLYPLLLSSAPPTPTQLFPIFL